MYMYLIYRRAIYIKLLNWILPKAIETLKSDDGDGNENVTKAIGLITKATTVLCTCITLFCTFLWGHCTTTT